MDVAEVPAGFAGFLKANSPPKLYTCPHCKQVFSQPVALDGDEELSPGTCISCECENIDCEKKATWFVCCNCSVRFPRRGKAVEHFRTKKHKNKSMSDSSSVNTTQHLPPQDIQVLEQQPVEEQAAIAFNVGFDAPRRFHAVQEVGIHNTIGMTDSFSTGSPPSGFGHHNMDEFSISQQTMTFPSSSGPKTKNMATQTETVKKVIVELPCFIPKPTTQLSPDGEWLADVLDATPRATATEVDDALKSSNSMRLFWVSEHSTPNNNDSQMGGRQMGGGLVYIVGRAFQKSILLHKSALPSYPEAKWHMKIFMQYQTMSDKQRGRQAQILAELMTDFAPEMFKHTRIPNAKELRKIYGAGNLHSMWNTLPIPPVTSIGDIAYVSPVDICTFAFANGGNFDDIYIRKNAGGVFGTPTVPARVFHISECAAVQEMKKNVIEVMQTGDCEFEVIILLPTCDWRDGHGVNHTKGNRPSVVTWTYTISPTKTAVNSTSNTFAVAIGSKKSKAWSLVEQRFLEDSKGFGDPTKPLMVYHGGLGKLVRVFMKRIISLEDRPERAAVTQTLAYNGGHHRRWGHLFQFNTPLTKPVAIKEFLGAEAQTERDIFSYGWSSDPSFFVSADVNGFKMVPCKGCRAWRVGSIMGFLPGVEDALTTVQRQPCTTCSDWRVDERRTAKMLAWPAHADFPRKAHIGPDAPPQVPGRSVPLPTILSAVTGEEVPFMEHKMLDFNHCIMAMRVAFHNITRPTTKDRWSKKKMEHYLKSNGINEKLVSALYVFAQEVLVAEEMNKPEYYNDPCGIGPVKFPSSWRDGLDPLHYIEMVMHIDCLGVSQANFELISLYFKLTKNDTAFKRNAQRLLEYIQKLGLGWFLAYNFNHSAKKGYTTGPWVSENWLAFVRVSKIVYGWCEGNGSKGNSCLENRQKGCDNVVRMVNAWTAVMARHLTHSGVSAQDIQDIDNFTKEFLSCVNELDILVRYDNMKQPKKKAIPGAAHVIIEELGEFGPQQQAGSELVPPIGNAATTDATGSQKKKKRGQGGDASASGKKKRKKKNATTLPTANTAIGETDEKVSWWSRANYVSLLNLTETIKLFGPLVNWWDGGGKGEKFIQLVKPLITKGIRERDTFFVRVMERLYKVTVMHVLDLMYGLFQPIEDDDTDNKVEYYLARDGSLRPIEELRRARNNNLSVSNESGDDDDDAAPLFDDSVPLVATGADVAGMEYSPVEDSHMAKDKTIYIYKDKQLFQSAFESHEPIAGVVAHDADKPHSEILQLYAIYRVRKAKGSHGSPFGWVCIDFDDESGEYRAGLWYASIKRREVRAGPPLSHDDLAKYAKMSAVAIPCSYAIGTNDADASNKYCVLTNWWKERTTNGKYKLPGLHPTLYQSSENDIRIHSQELLGVLPPNVI